MHAYVSSETVISTTLGAWAVSEPGKSLRANSHNKKWLSMWCLVLGNIQLGAFRGVQCLTVPQHTAAMTVSITSTIPGVDPHYVSAVAR